MNFFSEKKYCWFDDIDEKAQKVWEAISLSLNISLLCMPESCCTGAYSLSRHAQNSVMVCILGRKTPTLLTHTPGGVFALAPPTVARNVFPKVEFGFWALEGCNKYRANSTPLHFSLKTTGFEFLGPTIRISELTGVL